MTGFLGDLRGRPEASIKLAQASLRAFGYMVASDSDPIGIDPHFRTTVLPEYAGFLREDIYPVPPQGRLRADGLAEYMIHGDGTVRLTRDYEKIAIPAWSGSRLIKHRVYPNGLPIMDHPSARSWPEGVITLASHELRSSRGTIGVHYFETGRGAGKVVEGRHRDGELVVGSFVDYVNGGGAETSLDRVTPDRQDLENQRLRESPPLHSALVNSR